jgi:hypothetical protein
MLKAMVEPIMIIEMRAVKIRVTTTAFKGMSEPGWILVKY